MTFTLLITSWSAVLDRFPENATFEVALGAFTRIPVRLISVSWPSSPAQHARSARLGDEKTVAVETELSRARKTQISLFVLQNEQPVPVHRRVHIVPVWRIWPCLKSNTVASVFSPSRIGQQRRSRRVRALRGVKQIRELQLRRLESGRIQIGDVVC